jgi:hypothetical protein
MGQQGPKKAAAKRLPQEQGGPKTLQVMLRCRPQFLSLVDNWRSKQRPIPSRPQAIQWLAEKGVTEP